MRNLPGFILINLFIISLFSFPSVAEDMLSQPVEEALVEVRPEGQFSSSGGIVLRIEWNNPFNPEAADSADRYTRIYYKVTEQGATIRVYSINGELVRTLVENTTEMEPTVPLQWDGRNDKGRVVGSGVYLVNLKIGKSSKTVKVVVLK
ncbi:MAG TPA: T9SS type A sorting domain-containing protein [bacterium]|nr:T9SS type A sorting domain-containing protein [bacterium]